MENDFKTDMALLKKDIEYIKRDVRGISDMIAEQDKKWEDRLNKMYDDLDEKKADKWTEKAWAWVITIVMTMVIGAIVGLVVIR